MINGGTFDSLCGHIMCGSIDDPGMSKMFDNNMTEIFYNIQNMYIQRIQTRDPRIVQSFRNQTNV